MASVSDIRDSTSAMAFWMFSSVALPVWRAVSAAFLVTAIRSANPASRLVRISVAHAICFSDPVSCVSVVYHLPTVVSSSFYALCKIYFWVVSRPTAQ